jgi:hypothetical protein
MIRVRRLGYAPVYFSATLAAGDARRIDVELERLPAQLSEAVVRGQSGYGRFQDRRMQAFEWRRRSGWGRFLTRDDLARYGSAPISEVVRMASVHFLTRRAAPLSDGLAGSSQFLARPTGTADLPAWAGWEGLNARSGLAVSLNGGPANPASLEIDLPADWVDAVEIYPANRAPLELGRVGGGPVLVLWTGTTTSNN